MVGTGQNAVFPGLEDIFEVTVTFDAPVLLAAGRSWLGLREGVRGSAMDGTEVMWLSTPGQVGAARWFFLDGQNLANLQGPTQLDSAFQILATQQVPEPGSAALVALALLLALALQGGKARAATVHRAHIVPVAAAINNFDAVSFYGGSGWLDGVQTMYFELADDGLVVLSGTLAATFGGSWYGFAGGDFDELRLRASKGFVSSLADCPSGGAGGASNACNFAWLDDIRVGRAGLLPEPGSAALVLLGMGLMGLLRLMAGSKRAGMGPVARRGRSA